MLAEQLPMIPLPGQSVGQFSMPFFPYTFPTPSMPFTLPLPYSMPLQMPMTMPLPIQIAAPSFTIPTPAPAPPPQTTQPRGVNFLLEHFEVFVTNDVRDAIVVPRALMSCRLWA